MKKYMHELSVLEKSFEKIGLKIAAKDVQTIKLQVNPMEAAFALGLLGPASLMEESDDAGDEEEGEMSDEEIQKIEELYSELEKELHKELTEV
jgi:hypothetical protein